MKIGLKVIAAAALVAGCSPSAQQGVERWIAMSATSCVREAIRAGRQDLVERCLLAATDRGEEILAQALSDQTCTIPTDAGADR